MLFTFHLDDSKFSCLKPPLLLSFAKSESQAKGTRAKEVAFTDDNTVAVKLYTTTSAAAAAWNSIVCI